MNKENTVKFIIAGLLFLICCLVIIIVSIYKNEHQIEDNTERFPFDMQLVTEYSSFFSVANTLNQYLYYNSTKNNIAIYNLLNEEYIEKNNITLDNIFTKIETYINTPNIKVKKMYYEENDSNYLFYVIGDIILSEFDEIKVLKADIKFFVLMDYTNMTISIYPYNYEEGEIPIQNKKPNISKNNYNEVQPSGVITDNYICNLYFSDYGNKLINNLEDSYELLEESFKNKNYADKEKFINFMNSKIDDISMEIISCNGSNKEKQRIYTIKDANNNTFTFIEDSIMNYKVIFNIKSK